MTLFITLIFAFVIVGLILGLLIGSRESLIKYGHFEKSNDFQKPTKYLKEQQVSSVIIQIIIVVLSIAQFLIGVLVLDYLTFGSF